MCNNPLLKRAATPMVNLRRVKAIVDAAQAGSGSWAIISPMRANWDETLGVPEQSDSKEFTDRTNQLMTEEIKKDMREMNLGFRPCQGVGQEENGEQNREDSFFIPNVRLKQAEEMWHNYYQWGIVYCGPETKGQIILMGPDGLMSNLGTFHEGRNTRDNPTTPDVEEDLYWTEVKKKPFVFK